MTTPPIRPSDIASRRTRRDRSLWWGLRALLVIAIALRIWELAGHKWTSYEHDGAQHAEYANYVHVHHALAPLDLGEGPQQPLYYLLAAPLCHADETPDQNMEQLAPLGLCISLGTLALAYAALRYLSAWLLRYGFFVFMALNPAFILAACCVGNDGLSAFFGTLFFLCLLRVNRQPGRPGYFSLGAGAMLGAFLTKLTAAVLPLGLPFLLWRRAGRELSWQPTARRVAVIAVALGIIAGAVLDRAWDKDSHQFVLVHAWIWDYMEIKTDFRSYLLSFRLPNLIEAGQTTTDGGTPDAVRFSFSTFEYGNMLLGEYAYANDWVLGSLSRLVVISGTILLFSLLLFFGMTLFSRPLWPWPRLLTLNRTALALVLGSTVLLLHYVHSFPDTCNADYRFQAMTFPWMGYGIGRGLCAFPRSPFWTRAMTFFLGLFAALCVAFISTLFYRRG